MNTVNGFLSTIFDWLMAPLAAWPLMSLIFCSIITGLLMSIVFKYTSNQTALARVLDRSRGHILAIKLFKDDLPGMFRSLFHVFRLVLMRLCYSIVPVLVMIVPLFFLLAQLYLRYEFRPLQPGESAIVELNLEEQAWEGGRSADLSDGNEFTVETAALRDEELKSVFWRVKAGQTGTGDLKWQLDASVVEKGLVVAEDSTSLRQVNQRRVGAASWERFWFAGEPGLENGSPVRTVAVDYPRRETPVFGFAIPWWLTFFVVSIIAAMLSQPFLKVRF